MAENEVAEPHELNNEEIERLSAPHDQCVAYFERELIHAPDLAPADKSAVMNVFWCLLSLVEEHPSPAMLQIIRRASRDLAEQRTSMHPENPGSLNARRLNALEVMRAFCELKWSDSLLSTLAGIEGCFRDNESFNVLSTAVDVGELIETYDAEPRGKPGKRGAESILAELCWECGGLGFNRDNPKDPDETRKDGVERIRKALVGEWSKFEAGANTQPNGAQNATQEKKSKNIPASKRL